MKYFLSINRCDLIEDSSLTYLQPSSSNTREAKLVPMPSALALLLSRKISCLTRRCEYCEFITSKKSNSLVLFYICQNSVANYYSSNTFTKNIVIFTIEKKCKSY